MAYQTTWPGLQADILINLEDQSGEALAALPGAIAESELQVLRDLDLEIFQQEIPAGNLTANTRTFQRPATVVKINDLWLTVAGVRKYIQKRTKGFCEMFAEDPSVKKLPTYWADQTEGLLLFVDTPDQAYPVIVYGIARPPGLGPTVLTTWLSLYAADILLLACLIRMEKFLSNPNQVGAWKEEYAGKLAAAKIELRGMARSTYEMARMAGQAGNPL